MNRYLIIFSAILLLSGYIDISEANKLFLSSDYKGAIAKYNEVVKTAVDDPDLFFNLGTAYLYSGEYGKAIYWYYRTMLLTGTSEDIEKNLKIAYKGLEEEGIVFGGSDSILFDLLSRYYHPIITIILIILVNILFFILILRRFLPIRGNVKIFINILVIFVILLSTFVSLRIYLFYFQTRGIVIEKSIEVKEGPSDAYKTLNKIDEGSIVRILEKYDNYLRIKSADGKVKGWVILDNIGLLRMGRL